MSHSCVMPDAIHRQVRELWRTLAGASGAVLEPDTVTVVGPGGFGICPDGWVGMVLIEDAVLAQAPIEILGAVEKGLLKLTSNDGPVQLLDRLSSLAAQSQSVLGPAALFYGLGSGPARSAHVVKGPLPLTDPTVQAVLASAPLDELDESDLSNSDSGIYVALDPERRAMSASGHRCWPCDVAHMSVLTRPSARGQGYARSAAGSTLAQAADYGLLAQWRAAESNPGSIALARSLGLAQFGWQVSFKPVIPD